MARRSHTPAALLGVALAALWGCSCDSVPEDAIEECGALVTPGGVATDILFVIDDSTSMQDEQDLLAEALEGFIRQLDASPVANDFRIGVTTTSVLDFDGSRDFYLASGLPYPAGTLVAVQQDDAGEPVPGSFIYVGNAYSGPRILPSGSPTLVRDFRANVRVGTAGSRREQPFAAARLALEKSGPNGENAGFLRPGARLAIVFLSDEDDCSGPANDAVTQASCGADKDAVGQFLVPVSDPDGDGLAEFLRGPLGGEPRDVMVAAIVGVAPEMLALSCGAAHCSNKSCGSAIDKGDRFVALLNALGPERTRLGSICDATFGDTLADIADVIMPTTLPLDGAPADWRMLVVRVKRDGTEALPCVVAPAEAPQETRAAADAVYDPPRAGHPASLRFQNGCALRPGDQVDVNVICAR